MNKRFVKTKPSIGRERLTRTSNLVKIFEVRKVVTLLMAISLMVSMSFSGFGLEGIVTLIHITKHQHGISNEHEDPHESNPHHHDHELEIAHDHDRNSGDDAQPAKKSKNFNITHQHTEKNGERGEPHEHTVNLSSSIVALVKELPITDLALLAEAKYSPPYNQNRISSPHLDGLYRPPKC